ncbi:MAG: DUF1080 domain-containing protein [Pseudomonadales bacterium]|nr:DUF1080 domain-containing protein [Pseudomonadales bacterium]
MSIVKHLLLGSSLSLLLAACGGADDSANTNNAAAVNAGAADSTRTADNAGAGDWLTLSGSLDGWRQIGTANWRLENGEFVADSGNGHLVTQADYDNFQIRLEFWVDEPANSGVFLRASDPNAINQGNAYEVNIYDTRPDPAYRTGAIVEFVSPSAMLNTANQWNTYDITADGNHLVVVLNGMTTVDAELDAYQRGPISLQYGAGVVKFRNIEIREL